MAKIFITGSADGLGSLAAKSLVDGGHQVVLHARNTARAREAMAKTPGALSVLTADLSGIEECKNLAREVNALGSFDAVIHNAGVYKVPAEKLLAVNVLAPYILTCLVHKPKRLVYLSSGMHLQTHPRLDDLKMDRLTYSDSKLYLVMLCMAVARKWPDIYSNAVDPGWVPTKMGGKGAPGDLQKGYETQVWLCVSNDQKAKVSGRYFFHHEQKRHHIEADDVVQQEKLLSLCRDLTGVRFPG